MMLLLCLRSAVVKFNNFIGPSIFQMQYTVSSI
jgi:hypothetical protein